MCPEKTCLQRHSLPRPHQQESLNPARMLVRMPVLSQNRQ